MKSQSPTDQTFLLNARIEKLRVVIDRLEKSLQGPFYSNIEHTFYKLRLEETIQMNKQLLSKYEKELLAMGEDIAFSRNMAKVHYPSDTEVGKLLGNDLYDHLQK